MKSFRASHDRDQSHYYRNYSRTSRGFLIISWGVGLYNRDKQIKIEEAIDIYVIRLKINRCFVTFVPHLVAKSWQFNTHYMGYAK